MSDRTHEREALEEGISTEFWKLFGEHVTYEWGPAGIRYQQAVRAAAESQTAVVELQKILYAQEQIRLLMLWAAERVSHLKQEMRHPAEVSMSRRGHGL